MKNYLLLFLSSMILLFLLPKTGSYMQLGQAMGQSTVKSSCMNKQLVKRTCAKKCLKHQTHSKQQQDSNIGSDCSQHVVAIISLQANNSFCLLRQLPETGIPADSIYFSPDRTIDPEPPKLA